MEVKPELMKKETSCITTNTLIKYAEFKGINIDKFLEGIPYSYDYLTNTDNWILHEITKSLYEKLVELTHDPFATLKAGMFSQKLRTLGMTEKIGRLLAGPDKAYERCEKISWKFNRIYEMNAEEVNKKHAVIRVTYLPGFEPTKAGCRYTMGILSMAPTHWMLPKAEINELQCQAEGADSCLYNISFQEKRSFFKNFWFLTFGTSARLKEALDELEKNYNVIEQQRDELLEHKTNLEQKVQDRTKELRFANEKLKKAYNDLQAAQTELIQQGTLASAGRLAIGVAHNIRNPIESVRRNLGQLKKMSKEVLFLYMQEISKKDDFSDDDLVFLQDFIEKKYFEDEPLELLDTREIKDRAKELETIVKSNNLDLNTQQVKKIAEFNITEKELDKLVHYLKSYDPNEIMPILTTGYKLGVYTATSIDSIIMANNIINATMTYAGIKEKKAETDINAHIENILMLMQGSFKKYNISLHRNFDENLPRIEINQAMLNQVYENLFANAIYAMRDVDGERVLSIKTYQENDIICFDVIDTGQGIPAEHKDKIFQPFFTTKPEGEGTGTGLWTVYNTIKAIGEIEVDSRPNYTKFTVKIDKEKIK